MKPAPYFQGILTLKDVEVQGKRVLVRVDFNVPLKGSEVGDDFRIRSALPTIRYILDHGGRPILISHLGRPKGKPVAELSMKPVRKALQDLLGVKVSLAPDCVGDEAKRLAQALPAGEVLLLENSRFHPEEEANDRDFSRQLGSLADIYVNDAFGSAHRAHASTDGVTHYMKPAVAGFLMEKELTFLGQLLSRPPEPFVAIIGGAKISGKIEILTNLLGRVDALLLGGGIANNFLKAQGREIGNSLCEDDSLGVARDVMELAKTRGVAFKLPDDLVVAGEVAEGAAVAVVQDGEPVPPGFSIVDIGEKTVVAFIEHIARARTIFWNGPMGVFEIESFSHGTVGIARSVAAASQGGAVSIVGGGDTASAVARAGVKDKITHISTGGGASLEFLEGKELPGIKALSRKREV